PAAKLRPRQAAANAPSRSAAAGTWSYAVAANASSGMAIVPATTVDAPAPAWSRSPSAPRRTLNPMNDTPAVMTRRNQIQRPDGNPSSRSPPIAAATAYAGIAATDIPGALFEYRRPLYRD